MNRPTATALTLNAGSIACARSAELWPKKEVGALDMPCDRAASRSRGARERFTLGVIDDQSPGNHFRAALLNREDERARDVAMKWLARDGHGDVSELNRGQRIVTGS